MIESLLPLRRPSICERAQALYFVPRRAKFDIAFNINRTILAENEEKFAMIHSYAPPPECQRHRRALSERESQRRDCTTRCSLTVQT